MQKISMSIFSLGLLSLTACMSSEKEEKINTSINELKLELSKVREDIAKKQLELGVIKNTTEVSVRSAQGAKGELEEARKETALMRGEIDEVKTRLDRLLNSTSKSSTTTDGISMRMSDLEEYLNEHNKILAKLEIRDQHKEQSKSKTKSSFKYTNASEIEQSLQTNIANKDYKKAIILANQALNSEQMDDAGREITLRLRGESYFMMQNYIDSIIDLTNFIDYFPKSIKRPRALLLVGDSYNYLKKINIAKSYYSDCIKSSPEGPEAKAAKDRLSVLGN